MRKHFYLIHIQYLGFRYHGWPEQPGQLTVQKMVNKTLQFVLGHKNFKCLVSSRTDSKVSASETAFELFVGQKINAPDFLEEFNKNLPADIRALHFREVNENFNVIQNPKVKEYVYLFSFGQKAHPFAAPLVASFPEVLNLEVMMKAASIFEGTHNFRSFQVKPSPQSTLVRKLEKSEIVKNTFFTASFFPDETFAYRVRGTGFGRNQIRMMMGQLVELGRGKISLDQIRAYLSEEIAEPLKFIAPASGLILHKTLWDKPEITL